MSTAALDRLVASEEALIRALDGHDALAIEAAVQDFRVTLEGLKAIGAWHDVAEVTARLTHALRLADAARIRTNYLADRTRRQIDRLAALRPGVGKFAYGRDGRVRAA